MKLFVLHGFLALLPRQHKMHHAFAVLILIFFTGHGALANESRKITFSCWINKDLPAFIELEALYRTAFSTIGYEFTMLSKPPLRSLAEANSGIVDGECVRVANYLESAPDSPLQRIEVMIAKTNLDAWSHNKTLSLNGPASLANTNLKIAYGKGNVAMEMLRTRIPFKKIQEVSSIEIGIKMLARKRFDVLISPRAIFMQELALNPVNEELYFIGTLMALEGYPYLHERHKDIIPAFTAALRERIPADGLTLP